MLPLSVFLCWVQILVSLLNDLSVFFFPSINSLVHSWRCSWFIGGYAYNSRLISCFKFLNNFSDLMGFCIKLKNQGYWPGWIPFDNWCTFIIRIVSTIYKIYPPTHTYLLLKMIFLNNVFYLLIYEYGFRSSGWQAVLRWPSRCCTNQCSTGETLLLDLYTHCLVYISFYSKLYEETMCYDFSSNS